MQITKNFHLNELTYSNTAVIRKIDNRPNQAITNNLIEATKKLFQPARDILGKPMRVSSGYRSNALNKAIGGSTTSAHSYGYAIDFKVAGMTTRELATVLARELKAKSIKFDQLILEYPDSRSTWIHLGYKNRSGQQRGQVLTAKKIGGRTKYLPGLV